MFLLDKDHTISKKEQYKSRARFITSEENDYDDCRSYYGPQFDRIDTYESFLDIINDKHKRKLLLYGNSNQLTIYDYEFMRSIMRIERISTNYVSILILSGNVLIIMIYQNH